MGDLGTGIMFGRSPDSAMPVTGAEISGAISTTNRTNAAIRNPPA